MSSLGRFALNRPPDFNFPRRESEPFSMISLIDAITLHNSSIIEFGRVKRGKKGCFQLIVIQNIIFPFSGNYNVSISQAMRKNGSIDGIKELHGISDVGFRIEKVN